MSPSSDFQTLLLPLLESLNDGQEHSLEYINEELTRFVELSDEALKPFDIVGNKPGFQKGVLLAMEHLATADLIENTKADHFRITALGKMILSKRLNALTIDYLRRLPGYSGKA